MAGTRPVLRHIRESILMHQRASKYFVAKTTAAINSTCQIVTDRSFSHSLDVPAVTAS